MQADLNMFYQMNTDTALNPNETHIYFVYSVTARSKNNDKTLSAPEFKTLPWYM
jgi:hypothetical protein